MNFKAEALSRILDDAKEAKENTIEGYNNAYEPNDYIKIRNETLAMAQMESGDTLVPMHRIGNVEFDKNGNLKKIARNSPAMLDLAFLTRNRYDVETIIPANEKRAHFERGTYIVVVIGNAIVKAISDTVELPKNIKAYRFKKEIEEEIVEVPVKETPTDASSEDKPEEGKPEEAKKEFKKEIRTHKVWKYVGSELIPSERAYKMTRQLKPHDMLNLLSQIKDGVNGSENIGGDSLEDIE